MAYGDFTINDEVDFNVSKSNKFGKLLEEDWQDTLFGHSHSVKTLRFNSVVKCIVYTVFIFIILEHSLINDVSFLTFVLQLYTSHFVCRTNNTV